VEDGILMPQPLELLHDGPSSAALEVEQVLRVPIQRSHPRVEVRALEVGHHGKCALNNRFYRSNGVSVPTENGSNIPIMGFSLTSPYNGLFKSSP
jgi:hypothetical protein